MSGIDFAPGNTQVHIWAIWLTAPAEVNRAFRGFLSRRELVRADRFVFEHLSRSYELSQGALRLLLAHSLRCNPREVEFRFGPRGKPMLEEGSRVRFNLAHSGGLALYSFTLDTELGIDVEELRDISDIEQIASH